MACWKLHPGQPVKVHSGERQDGFECIEQRGMDSLKVLQHKRSAFLGIPAEIMATVEGMEEAVALLKRLGKNTVQRIERLRVIVQAIEELAERIAIDGAQYVCRPCRIRVF